MSHANWIVSLSRLNYASGILAGRGDEDMALAMVDMCVEHLERAVYERRVAVQDTIMLDTFEVCGSPACPSASPAAPSFHALKMANYTIAEPCPDKVATTGRRGKAKARKPCSDDKLRYNLADERDERSAESCSGGHLASTERPGR
jgi:hypothetical protein